MALVLHLHVEQPAALPGLATEVVGLLGTAPAPVPLTAAARLQAEPARTTKSHTLLLQAVALRPREATVLARLAWMTHRMGFGTQAATVLDEAIALRPDEPAVRREVGNVLVATGRLSEGLSWFEDLARTFPQNRDFQIRLAEVTVWAGEYVRGLERLEKVLGADLMPRSLWHTFVDAASSAPTLTASQVEVALRLAKGPLPLQGVSGQTLYLSRLAWSLFREGERTKSAVSLAPVQGLLDRALQLQPRDPPVRRELAGMLTAARRFKDALALYAGLAREFPQDEELLVQLAEVTAWSGDLAGGLERFESLLQNNVRRPRVWAGFVNAAAAAPTLTRSQAELAFQLANNPPLLPGGAGEVAYLSCLGWALQREGQRADDARLLARAAALAEQALALKPRLPEERRDLAGLLAAVGKTGSALALLDGTDKEDVRGRLLVISILAGQKRLAEAEAEARRLAEKNPNDLDVQFQLASVLAWNKKPEQAAVIFEKLLKANPTDARLPRKLAEVALWASRYDTALERYHALLARDWQQPDLWAGYVDSASAVQKVPADPHKKLLLRIYEPVAARPGKDAVFLSRFGWVLRRLEEPKKSVKLLRQSLALAAEDREIRMRLAEALQDAGDYAEAERHFQVLLQAAPQRP